MNITELITKATELTNGEVTLINGETSLLRISFADPDAAAAAWSHDRTQVAQLATEYGVARVQFCYESGSDFFPGYVYTAEELLRVEPEGVGIPCDTCGCLGGQSVVNSAR